MIRSAPAFALAGALLLGASACDTSPAAILTPVAEVETSFEDGLGDWSVRTGPSGGGTGAVVQGDASVGSSYFEAVLQGPGDVVWIERSFTLEAGGEYRVTVSADARAFSGSGELVHGAGAQPLGAGALQSQGPAGSTWTRELMPLPVTADAQGRVWVGVGLSASTSGAGTFGLDRVGVVFIRDPDGN